MARLSGSERPLEVMYFVEGQNGKRIPAEKTAATLNRLDLQRAAIVLGHRVRRPLAQRESHLSLPHLSVSHLSLSLSHLSLSLTCLSPAMETLSVPPAETQSSSILLIVGVVVPVLLAVFIIIILYWKLCGSEKLEFQPDAINTIQQRQKVSGQREVVGSLFPRAFKPTN